MGAENGSGPPAATGEPGREPEGRPESSNGDVTRCALPGGALSKTWSAIVTKLTLWRPTLGKIGNGIVTVVRLAHIIVVFTNDHS